ncbi:hypothetical protein H4S08_004934 [Coemansia sp. RSA 1365]|nr:hypothetical protein H4S08_004934 [Coemansia sp. RSA 1365]
MNFGDLLGQAKGAYDRYQQSNSSEHNQGAEHNPAGGNGYQQGNGPEPSHYQGQQYNQSQEEYGNSGRKPESDGFDMNKISLMAYGYLNGNKESSGHSSSAGGGSGGIDFGKIAGVASGFLGNQHGNSGGSGGQSDIISSALKMAMGKGGFNNGNEAKDDDIKSSYQNIFGSSSGGLASQGQNAMGLAAAYKAFQQFQQDGGHTGSSDGQNKLVSMAIAQAKKLFDQHSSQGGEANEKETLATAVQAAMKLLNNK